MLLLAVCGDSRRILPWKVEDRAADNASIGRYGGLVGIVMGGRTASRYGAAWALTGRTGTRRYPAGGLARLNRRCEFSDCPRQILDRLDEMILGNHPRLGQGEVFTI